MVMKLYAWSNETLVFFSFLNPLMHHHFVDSHFIVYENSIITTVNTKVISFPILHLFL